MQGAQTKPHTGKNVKLKSLRLLYFRGHGKQKYCKATGTLKSDSPDFQVKGLGSPVKRWGTLKSVGGRCSGSFDVSSISTFNPKTLNAKP